MADNVRVDSGSPERVATELMHRIMVEEGKQVAGTDARKYILDLYAECVEAAKGKRAI